MTVQAKAGKISDGLEDHTFTRLLLKAPPSGGASGGRLAPSNTSIFQEFNIFLKNACERLRKLSDNSWNLLSVQEIAYLQALILEAVFTVFIIYT